MSAELLSGTAIAKRLRAALQAKIATRQPDARPPSLAVVLVGEDPASQVYVNHKIKACQDIGMTSVRHALPADTTQQALQQLIVTLNEQPDIDGMLVQLPLPSHLSSQTVIETISPAKDVDGFHVINVGQLCIGKPRFVPCTPAGVMVMLQETGLSLVGRHAVVIGSSNIVGKPMALLLQQAGATVTLCNSKTQDLKAHTRMADIIVAAVGKPNLITADHVKLGAVVIDVGINRLADGKLVGDVDFDSVREQASWITPVPGGVGPMTIAMLLTNTVTAWEQRHHA